MRALRAIGLADAVAAKGMIATRGEVRRGDGKTLKAFDLAKVRDALGEDTVCALRPALHGTLLEALPESAFRLGAAATGFTQDETGVTVQLAGGGSERGDLLVGADGFGSVIRRLLLGDSPPRPTGLVAWRGVARGVNAILGGVTGAQYLARGIEAGTAQASPDTVYWYVSAHDRGGGTDSKTAVRERIKGFDPRFLALVDATAPEDMRRDVIVDREPVERWSDRRVTLLGDAAHPMTPHAGQGAAQALEDAVALGQALAKNTDIAAALTDYERQRIPRTTKIVELARGNAKLGSIENPAVCAVRDLAVRLMPRSVLLGRMIASAQS